MSDKFNSVAEAIEDIREGKVVLVFDDIARENEGDFIAASEHVTPEIINFMSKYGRGLICVAITEERARELSLERMVQNNTATLSTAFTVSVDLLGHGCTTGISAFDRSKTVKALVDKSTKPEDLGRPGHIFPLIANSNGVLGRMARLNDLVLIAREHNVKLISISQLAAYRKESK